MALTSRRSRRGVMKTSLKLGTLLLLISIGYLITRVTRFSKLQVPINLNAGSLHPVHSFFHKTHPLSGQYIDVQSPQLPPYWNPKLVVVDSVHSSDASLHADPSLIENGGQVTVSWENVPDPSKRAQYDWIGLYCPSDADSYAYLDYWSVNESPTYNKGYGSVAFTLYNMRVDCEFRYFGNDTYTELLAISNKVSFVNGREAPLQGHLALTGDATQMRIHWTTGTTSTPTVHYGTSADNLKHTATGITKTYSASDMCGPPANLSLHFLDPGYLHEVLLTGLQPNTKYYFQYGSPGSVFSKVKTFTSGLTSGDATPYTFITYGDLEISSPPGGETTAVLVHKEVEDGASFVMHAGDISYAVGYAYLWEQWMALVEPYSSLAPYMINIGNHEQDHLVGGEKDPSHAVGEGFHPPWGNYGHDSGGECGVPMFYRFHMPDNGNSVWWYSFEYGLAHYTVFSTEHDFTRGSRQYAWLEKDLQSVDRKFTPWLRKLLSEYKVTVNIRETLEDLIHKYQVNVGLWGHYHSYERTCAVYKEQCDANGTVHFIIGSAGCHLEPADTWDVPWVMHFERNFGYGRVSIVNRSALHWEYIRNSDKSIADSVWLTK